MNKCKDCGKYTNGDNLICDSCREYPYDLEEKRLDDICPYCGEEYDEIDYEYQICCICSFNNNN